MRYLFLTMKSLVQARINLKRLSHFFFISEVKPSPLGDDIERFFTIPITLVPNALLKVSWSILPVWCDVQSCLSTFFPIWENSLQLLLLEISIDILNRRFFLVFPGKTQILEFSLSAQDIVNYFESSSSTMIMFTKSHLAFSDRFLFYYGDKLSK